MDGGEVDQSGDDMADLGVAAGGGTGGGEIEPFGNADDVTVWINDSGVDVAGVEVYSECALVAQRPQRYVGRLFVAPGRVEIPASPRAAV